MMPRENLYRACMPGVELRAAADGGMPVMTGYATVWDAPTEINSRFEGRFIEKWQRGAFAKSIAERSGQIKVLLNHGQDPSVGDKPLGAITELAEDDHGLRYAVQLLDASYVRDLVPALEAGLFGASHRFTMLRDKMVDKPKRSAANPDALPERTVTEAKLHEFGPVTFPALEAATAGVRSLTDLIHDVEAITLATPILLDEERTAQARIFLTRPLPSEERAEEHSTAEAAVEDDEADTPVETTEGDERGTEIGTAYVKVKVEYDASTTAPTPDSADAPTAPHPVRGRRSPEAVPTLYGQGKQEPKWKL